MPDPRDRRPTREPEHPSGGDGPTTRLPGHRGSEAAGSKGAASRPDHSDDADDISAAWDLELSADEDLFGPAPERPAKRIPTQPKAISVSPDDLADFDALGMPDIAMSAGPSPDSEFSRSIEESARPGASPSHRPGRQPEYVTAPAAPVAAVDEPEHIDPFVDFDLDEPDPLPFGNRPASVPPAPPAHAVARGPAPSMAPRLTSPGPGPMGARPTIPMAPPLAPRAPVAAARPASSQSTTVIGMRADPRRDMEDRFASGDFAAALALAESLLDAGNDEPGVIRTARECRTRLQQTYLTRLGSLAHVPVLALSSRELQNVKLDPRAAFVLSRIDGASSIEEVIDVAGLPVLDVLRILHELMVVKVIRMQSPR